MPRLPAPTKIAVDLKGDSHGRRRGQVELEAPPGSPPKPDHIANDSIACEAWDTAVCDLNRMGILRAVDGKLLTHYATSWRMLRQAEQALASEGMPTGTKTTAAHRQWKDYSAEVMKCLIQMGMTPSARAAMRISSEEKGKGEWTGIIPNLQT